MALGDVVGGTTSLATHTNLTITPAAGVRYAITRIGHYAHGTSDYVRWAIGAVAGTNSPAVEEETTNPRSPGLNGPIFVDETSYLSLFNDRSSAQEVSWSGVKLN